MKPSKQLSETAPWEFRTRSWIAFAIYAFGFFAGYGLSYALGISSTSTYVRLGEHWGDTGIRAAAAIAAALTFAGFSVRWWASSFHRAGVVYSDRIETGELTAAGPYRYMRNPLYLGNILQAVGISSLGPPLATVIVIVLLTAFLYRLIRLEEKFLVTAQGDAYVHYSQAVPRLLPRLIGPTLPPSEAQPNVIRGLITELGSLGFAIWMIYYAVVAALAGPNTTFWVLFASAILLLVIGSVLNRRLLSDSRAHL